MEKTIERIKVYSLGCREKFQNWIKTRGGVVVWRNQDLSCRRGDMFTPVNGPDGKESPRPHWAYTVHETITDITRFKFATREVEVGRCKIALKTKGYDTMFGFMPTALVLTDGSQRRVDKLQHKLKEQHRADVTFYFEDREAAVFVKIEWEN
jgi:hypothetical protein